MSQSVTFGAAFCFVQSRRLCAKSQDLNISGTLPSDVNLQVNICSMIMYVQDKKKESRFEILISTCPTSTSEIYVDSLCQFLPRFIC